MIQRYDYEEYSVGMHKDQDQGEYVLRSDVLALLEPETVPDCCDGCAKQVVGANNLKARLRAALGAE